MEQNKNTMAEDLFMEPELEIVEISGSIIIADSDRCFWHSEY